MHWLEAFMWWLSKAIGTAMTFTGLAGLLLMTGYGLVSAAEYIIDKEAAHEDQD